MASTARTVLLCACVSCLISVTTTISILTIVQPARSSAQEGLVQVTGLQVIGRDGRLIATLGELPNDAVGLALWAGSAGPRASFGLDADGSRGLLLNDAQAHERVALSVPLAGGGAGLTVSDAHGEPRAVLSVESSGPHLGLLDERGTIAFTAGTAPKGAATPELPGTDVAPVLAPVPDLHPVDLADADIPKSPGCDLAPGEAAASDDDSSDMPETTEIIGAVEVATDGEPAIGVASVRAPAGFASARLRAAPSPAAPSLRTLPNGTRVELLEGVTSAGGFRWLRVRTPDGSTGWIVAIALRR